MNNLTMMQEAAIGQPHMRPNDNWPMPNINFDFGGGIEGTIHYPDNIGARYIGMIYNGVACYSDRFLTFAETCDWICEQVKRELADAF